MTRVLLLLMFLPAGFVMHSQEINVQCENYIKKLETEIVFNQYVTESDKVNKIRKLVDEVEKKDFDKKEIFLKYAQVNLKHTEEQNDLALYEFVELIEICDTTDQVDLLIYLGSLLKIGDILRENGVDELSYGYVEKGIQTVEANGLTSYRWIQNLYNDAGVDLLSMGEYEKSKTLLKRALFYSRKDCLQDAMIEYNLSFLFFENGNLDSAIFHQENTMHYLEGIDDLSSYAHLFQRYANSLGSLSYFYYSQENFEQARNEADRANLTFEKIDLFDSGRYPHLYTLINLALKDSAQDQIDILLVDIENVADKVELGKYNFLRLLSDAYRSLGDYTQENSYLQQTLDQFQSENRIVINKLQKYNSKLQAQILTIEKNRFQNEKKELNRKAFYYTLFISLILISIVAILYMLYIRTRNKKNILEKEKEISKIELEKNEIRSKLTESELNEKRMVTNRLASHIKLKQQTETAFLQKIKELKRKNTQDIEAEISELQVKMMNLINIDQNLEQHLQVDDIHFEFRQKLKENHPEINEKELQFCSYLLLNMSTKEIGSITNQSDGAIRVYKTRLKSKLIGEQEIDLIDYLQNI